MSDLQFDSPVGMGIERAGEQVWPGRWIDATGYAARYFNPATGRIEYHTGSDLNLNYPTFDFDRGSEVHAAADGLVVIAAAYPVWGNVLIMLHDLAGVPVWTRYAHLKDFTVAANSLTKIARGTLIGHIGKPQAVNAAYHLHFDIAGGVNLGKRPSDWPGSDLKRIQQGYFDPRQFILDHHFVTIPPQGHDSMLHDDASDERHTPLSGAMGENR